MKFTTRWLGLAALAFAGACGGGSGGGDGAPLVAAWRYVSGPAFSGPRFSDQDFEGDLRYLDLTADGEVRLLLQDAATSTLFCYRGVYAQTTGGLVVEIRRQSESVPFVFVENRPDGLTLELTDASGLVTTFLREAFVPASFECGTLEERALYPGLAAVPTFFTGMAFDGMSLWFTDESEDLVYPISPFTGVLGPPIVYDNSQFQMIHAAQGTDFWTHCRCGGSQEAQRRTQADAFVDQVDSETDLLERISVRGIAYDGGAAVLWLHGYADDNVQEFLKVNADVEPDVLLAVQDFDVTLRSMAWDGTHMWAITEAQNVIQIDMTTFQTVATFGTPDPNVEWIGIAIAPASFGGGDSLYLIGRDGTTGDGVLLEAQP